MIVVWLALLFASLFLLATPTGIHSNITIWNSTQRIRKDLREVRLYNTGFKRFYCELGFGSPRQRFRMLIDTGSSAIWVPSAEAPTTLWRFHDRFHSTNSRTAEKLPNEFHQSYISGDISGNLFKDHIEIGQQAIANVIFGAAIRVENFTIDPMFDGILGMAPKGFNPNMPTTLLGYMVQQGLVNKEIFGFTFQNYGLHIGLIHFGKTVEERMPRNVHCTPVVDPDTWSIRVTRIYIGGSAFPTFTYHTLLDTGSMPIDLPSSVVSSIHDKLVVIKMQGEMLIVDCSKVASFPKFEFALENVRFAVEPTEYILQYVAAGRQQCVSPFVATKFTNLIFGVSIIRAFDTLFDADKKRVGFAPVEFKSSATN